MAQRVQAETIQAIAETLGLTLGEGAGVALAADAEFRIREIVQVFIAYFLAQISSGSCEIHAPFQAKPPHIERRE